MLSNGLSRNLRIYISKQRTSLRVIHLHKLQKRRINALVNHKKSKASEYMFWKTKSDINTHGQLLLKAIVLINDANCQHLISNYIPIKSDFCT